METIWPLFFNELKKRDTYGIRERRTKQEEESRRRKKKAKVNEMKEPLGYRRRYVQFCCSNVPLCVQEKSSGYVHMALLRRQSII